jgi:hypothetical protein
VRNIVTSGTGENVGSQNEQQVNQEKGTYTGKWRRKGR